MVRALRASSYLTAVITGLALVMLVVGLVVSARPELGDDLGFAFTSRDGLAIALASGAVAIVAAILGRVFSLLSD